MNDEKEAVLFRLKSTASCLEKCRFLTRKAALLSQLYAVCQEK